jgi:hypothetical protein
MADTNKSWDLMSVFKDLWQTGTQELGKNVGSMLSSTPPNTTETGWGKTSWASNQVNIAQERREKDVIERRKG